MFNIKTKAGLPDTGGLNNRAGIYFDDNAVVMTDTTTDVIGIPTAVSKVPVAVATVYPNPAHDKVFIRTANYSSVTVCDMLGQQVMQSALTGSTTTLDISALPGGVYFLTLSGVQGNEVKKVVKW